MKERLNLTAGEIAPTLIKLARPIMATSFVQMLYNLTDQMWLGRYNTDALAGAGISGYIMWVGMATALKGEKRISYRSENSHHLRFSYHFSIYTLVFLRYPL